MRTKKKIQSVVFYVSKKETASLLGHQSRFVVAQTNGTKSLYVRAEIFDGDSLTAINRAKPRRGELLLNAIEI